MAKLSLEKTKQFLKTPGTWRRIGLILPFFLVALIFIVIPMILMIVKSFSPTSSGPMSLNWNFMNGFVWQKIAMSLLIAVITTVITMLLAYPFAYFLCFSVRSKAAKALLVLLVTAPIWMSMLIKIIGLKTLFDCINGYQNSTYGNVFTVIGLVYLYLPFMILPIFNVLEDMPKNLVNASKDLGYTTFGTFFKVVLPYTKGALASGITLVVLPSLTTVAVPQYMNASPSGTMIGDIMMQEGIMAQTSDLSLARASTFSFVIILVMVVAAAIIFGGIKIAKVIKRKKGGIKEWKTKILNKVLLNFLNDFILWLF